MKRGAALPAVLLALTITSALAIGGAFVSRQQAAAARFSGRGRALVPAAEKALVEAVSRWDRFVRDSQPIGQTVTLPAADGVNSVQVWATRVGPSLYWMVAESRTTVEPVLRRRIGILVGVDTSASCVIAPRGWVDLP